MQVGQCFRISYNTCSTYTAECIADFEGPLFSEVGAYMQDTLPDPYICTMLTDVHQYNRPAVAHFKEQFTRMAAMIAKDAPQLLQAFAVLVQASLVM